MESGYVLDFSNRTMKEWFEEEIGVNIEDERYCSQGNSKAQRLRRFIEIEPGPIVARMLDRLWEYRENYSQYTSSGNRQEEREWLVRLTQSLYNQLDDNGLQTPSLFAEDATLEMLVKSIKRYLDSGDFGSCIDRIHTYCMKRTAQVLSDRGHSVDQKTPLHSRFGEYRKLLQSEEGLSEMTNEIMKNMTNIFQRFNDIRNNSSLAHDNVLIEEKEARLIVSTMLAILRFIDEVEAQRSAGTSEQGNELNF